MMRPVATIRVGICEEDPLFRGLLSDYLRQQPDLEVVGAMASQEELALLVGQGPLDVLLLGLNLSEHGGVEGMAVAIDMRQQATAPKIIVLSSVDDDQIVADAFTLGGATNYILKAYYREIPEAIRQAYRGETSIHHSIAMQLVGQLVARSHGEIRDRLSPLQKQILTLLSQGLDRKQVAAQLFYTEQSINNEIAKTTKLLKGRFPYWERFRLKRQSTAEVVELAKNLQLI